MQGLREANMSHLITGVFNSRVSAEQAVEDLIRAGFSPDDVSLLMSETTQGREFAVKTGSKAPEGAAAGAAIGGTLGAILAGLAAVGSLAVPGLALVAAGPLVAALTGLGAGAAAGGLTGALVGLGLPEHEARFYHDEIKRGGILVGVYAHKDRVAQAKAILDAAGAEKVT
jgi:hypothetical protein